MTRGILFLFVSIAFLSCNIHRKDTVADGMLTMADIAAKGNTSVQIIDSLYNFGTATEGEKVTYNYRFKNTGKNPLVVTNTSASCGCTVPEKPDKPVLPGDTAFIKVVFNSQGKVGHNQKTITVASNANPAFPPLLLTGEVVEAKK